MKKKWIVPLQPSHIRIFHKDNIFLKRNGDKWGIADINGQFTLNPQFDYSLGYFYNGVVSITKNHQEGYINTKGEVVVKPTYDKTVGISNIDYDELFTTFQLNVGDRE